jgi:outer membrane receptor protein involved in Fe transport
VNFLATVAAGLAAVSAVPSDNVITFTPEFFEGAAPATAFDMVIRIPGFSFERGTNARGLTDASGNVLIDGRPPVSKNDLLEDILKRIPASSVRRIELIRGGALGINMRGKSVLANVVRKSERGVQGAASAEFYWTEQGQTLPGLKTQAQWDLGDIEIALSFQAGRRPDDSVTHGLRTRRAADGTLLSRSRRNAWGHSDRAWTTGALEAPLAGGRVKLTAAYKRNQYESRVSEIQSQTLATETEAVEDDGVQFETGARYLRSLGASAELEAVAFRQWQGVDTIALNALEDQTREFRLNRETGETVVRTQISWDQSRHTRIKVGTEAVLNTLMSETDYSESGIAIPIPAADIRVRERRNELFATVTTRPADSLMLEMGLRQEWSTMSAQGDSEVDKELTFTKPHVLVAWDFANLHQLRVRLAREVDQLSFDDFVASSALVNTGVVLAGNPDLDPQESWVARVAVERRFWSDGALIMGLSHSKFSNVIDLVPVRSAADTVIADAPGNIGAGLLTELEFSAAIPLDRFGLAGAEFHGHVTFRDSRVTDPTTGKYRGISRSFPREVEFRFRQDVPGTGFTWGVRAFTSMTERSYRYSEIEKRRLGVWVTPFLEYAPADGWLVRAELQAITKGDLGRTRYLFSGSRDSHALAYVDQRATTWGRAIYVDLRKTFGK